MAIHVFQRPVEADQSSGQHDGTGHTQITPQEAKPGNIKKHDGRQQAEENEQRPVNSLAAKTLLLGGGIAGQLPFHTRLVEQLHEIDLHQSHQHQAFPQQRQLLGSLVGGIASLPLEIGRRLPAHQPDQEHEQKEGEGQPEMDQQRKDQEEAELDWGSVVYREPGVQGVMNGLHVAGKNTDSLARTKARMASVPRRKV